MSKINEQIQRLRDVLVTCYNTIKRKGGDIPEAGERNMSNLPDAVMSIPQTHGVLTELEVTANGEYLPEEGVDGFSKVTARFDTSSLPKTKVFELRVSNACFDSNGYWNGNNIDVSEMSSLSNAFYGCSQARVIDVQAWDTSNIILLQGVFNGCTHLRDVDISNWDTSHITSLKDAFYRNQSLKILDLRYWNTDLVNTCSYMFYNCLSLTSLVGGISEEQVVMTAVSCLNGLKVSIDLSNTILDRASLRALINGLADVTDQPAESRPTLTLGTTLRDKLKDEDIAIVTNKGWNLA